MRLYEVVNSTLNIPGTAQFAALWLVKSSKRSKKHIPRALG